MNNLFIQTVLEGAKRVIGKGESGQKEPLTTEMAKQVVMEYAHPTNFKNHRTIVLCLLGFAGFLRISEILEIRIANLKFSTVDLQITIPKAKNDQIRAGHIVHISRIGSAFCPVHWTEKYAVETKLIEDPTAFLICRLAKTKSGHKPIGKYGLGDTAIRDIFNLEVVPICQSMEPGRYCLHSLRSGGASTAVNNGIDERLIGKHGRWKSGFTRDRYLKDSRNKRLSVTKALGL